MHHRTSNMGTFNVGMILTSLRYCAHPIKHPNILFPVMEVELCAPTPKKVQVFFPLSTNTTIQGYQHEGVCLVLVAFPGWKSMVLLGWEKEGPCSHETPLPTAGLRTHRVKFRPRWAVLWKSFVRTQHLVRKGAVLRSGLSNHISLLI